MKKSSEEGGVACGICSVSLQQASLGFGIADVTHGILGVAVMMSMIIKKEGDKINKNTGQAGEKVTGYAKFVEDCSWWIMYFLLACFVLQIMLGIILCLGASHRNSVVLSLWTIFSFLVCPLTPMTYNLLGLGRVYEWAAVGEFVLKMDKEERQYGIDNGGNNGIFYTVNDSDDEDGSI